MLSIPHMIVVFVIALVIFGPQKLPELARTLGKLMAEFRKASGDFRNAFEEEIRDLERQAALVERKKAAEASIASANAAPLQPATIGSPANVEAAEIVPAADTRQTEAPLIQPVAESVAREAGAVTPAEVQVIAPDPGQETPSRA